MIFLKIYEFLQRWNGESGVEVEVLLQKSNEILSVQKRRLHNEWNVT
jgi:NAD+--asparagine ADP-ribosyltransferase